MITLASISSFEKPEQLEQREKPEQPVRPLLSKKGYLPKAVALPYFLEIIDYSNC